MERITISGKFVRETGLSILIEMENGVFWLPKSQIDYVGDVGDEIDVELPAWLAKQEGLD